MLICCLSSKHSVAEKGTGEEKADVAAQPVTKPKCGWVDRARQTINNVEHFGKSAIFKAMNDAALLQVRLLFYSLSTLYRVFENE